MPVLAAGLGRDILDPWLQGATFYLLLGFSDLIPVFVCLVGWLFFSSFFCFFFLSFAVMFLTLGLCPALAIAVLLLALLNTGGGHWHIEHRCSRMKTSRT